MQLYKIKQTTPLNNTYPEQLLSISKPPERLFYKGELGVVNQHRNIAVIGSRHASDQGIELAFRIGHELGKCGINVVNGLALGCDTHALRGALAAGGVCVAVMPCGLEQIVPYSNSSLAERLLSNGGCLISEYPVQTPVRRYQYVERNRLQSGISDGVLVIEAECDSGTMHTVRYAMRQGRWLACIDSRLVRHSSGNRWLERQNRVHVIQNVIDINDFINDLYNKTKTVYRQVTFDEFVLERQGDYEK